MLYIGAMDIHAKFGELLNTRTHVRKQYTKLMWKHSEIQKGMLEIDVKQIALYCEYFYRSYIQRYGIEEQ